MIIPIVMDQLCKENRWYLRCLTTIWGSTEHFEIWHEDFDKRNNRFAEISRHDGTIFIYQAGHNRDNPTLLIKIALADPECFPKVQQAALGIFNTLHNRKS